MITIAEKLKPIITPIKRLSNLENFSIFYLFLNCSSIRKTIISPMIIPIMPDTIIISF